MRRQLPRRGVGGSPPGAARAGYLDSLLGVLWPGRSAAVESRGAGGPGAVDYLVLPDARRPRLLLPAAQRAAAAAALLRSGRRDTPGGRLAVRVAAAGVRVGAVSLVRPQRVRVRPGPAAPGPGDEPAGIEDYLRGVLGDVVLAVHLGGPARANRKPVVQVMRPGGEPVAYVKIGVDELTGRLVRTERLALDTLRSAGLRELRVPEVLHAGTWAGHEVLVQSVLPVWRRPAPPDAGRLLRAMREVAAIGDGGEQTLASSTYWAGLSRRVDDLGGPAPAVLRAAGARVQDRWPDLRLPFGCWHGDWSTWNMAYAPDRLLVWDWERFARPAPVGFDALHHRFQALGSGRSGPSVAVDALLDAAGGLLRPWGLDGSQAAAVALLYLVEIATRYAADGQAAAGARLGDLWRLLPAVLDGRLAADGRSGRVPAHPEETRS